MEDTLFGTILFAINSILIASTFLISLYVSKNFSMFRELKELIAA